MNAFELIRKDLAGINQQILNHPILKVAEEGKLRRKTIEAIVVNEWYIVNHDVRSIAIGFSRSSLNELDLFKAFLDGDYKALKELEKLMKELNLEIKDPLLCNISPQAVSYTHYLSWLANYVEPSEFLFALIVNVPVWANVVTKIGDLLKEKYWIKETGFFDSFKGSYEELEKRISSLVNERQIERLKTISFTIQAYEKAFWDEMYNINSNETYSA